MGMLKAIGTNEYSRCEATIKVKVEYEHILIIGTENHPATDSTIRNVTIHVGVMDMPINAKMKFVMQALRKVLLNKDRYWTIMLCVEGYTHKQLNKIIETFQSIKNDDGRVVVKHILKTAHPDTIEKYINTGVHKGENVSTPRDRTKIETLGVYCHGLVGQFALWLGLATDPHPFSTAYAKDLKAESFTDDARIYSFACRTGIGNPKINKSVFYEERISTGVFSSRTEKRRYDEKFDESLAQILANSTEGTVFAYQRRSEYGETFNTSDELDFLDACDVFLNKRKPKRENNKKDNAKYKAIMDSGMTEEDKKQYMLLDNRRRNRDEIDNATFDPLGALHPVTSGTSPEGLPAGMWTYKPKN